MLKIGSHNKLEVLRSSSVGMFLGGKGKENVLLPLECIPDSLKVGDEIEVFIYRNSESRIIATNLSPKILLNSFAGLEVVAVDEEGVFFDIGLEKDLLVPFEEQIANVNASVGDKSIVYMFLDEESHRLVGSMKWRGFCFEDEPTYGVNEKAKIMIGEKTDLGRNVLIENKFYGLIYAIEIFEEIEIGDIREGYIKALREDGDIDVTLQEQGNGRVVSSSDELLELLKANKGILEIGDRSSPEKITSITGMSKKTFKKAIGNLYRKKLVLLEKEQVKLKVE